MSITAKERAARGEMPTKPYIFFRKEGFYPVTLYDDDDARTNAELNPGTLRVEDAYGRVIWSLQ